MASLAVHWLKLTGLHLEAMLYPPPHLSPSIPPPPSTTRIFKYSLSLSHRSNNNWGRESLKFPSVFSLSEWNGPPFPLSPPSLPVIFIPKYKQRETIIPGTFIMHSKESFEYVFKFKMYDLMFEQRTSLITNACSVKLECFRLNVNLYSVELFQLFNL